jgi:hypothetical protein
MTKAAQIASGATSSAATFLSHRKRTPSQKARSKRAKRRKAWATESGKHAHPHPSLLSTTRLLPAQTSSHPSPSPPQQLSPCWRDRQSRDISNESALLANPARSSIPRRTLCRHFCRSPIQPSLYRRQMWQRQARPTRATKATSPTRARSGGHRQNHPPHTPPTIRFRSRAAGFPQICLARQCQRSGDRCATRGLFLSPILPSLRPALGISRKTRSPTCTTIRCRSFTTRFRPAKSMHSGGSK